MKVSVITTTYKHTPEQLKRAILSVNDQIGVEYEHIIVDDNVCHKGMLKTYQEAFKQCRGEYIAFLDGDDYWCDCEKLLYQVGYMDHNECGMCITLAWTYDGKLQPMTVTARHVNDFLCYDSLLKGTVPIHAQTYLIRKSDFDKYIKFEEFLKFNTWDLPICLELIRHVKFHCLPFYTAVYVKNEESHTNTRSRKKRLKYILGLYRIKMYFILKYGCKMSTIIYLVYRFIRHIYSIIFKRWK